MTDYTGQFNLYAQQAAAPPIYFTNGSEYVGLYDPSAPTNPTLTSQPRSLPRGATIERLQLPLDGQTLSKEFRAIQKWKTPRLPASTLLTFSSLCEIPGDVEITTLPSVENLSYGVSPFSQTLGAYRVSYSQADISRLIFPPDFKVGVCALKLGGTKTLGQSLAENDLTATDVYYSTLLATTPAASLATLVAGYTTTTGVEAGDLILSQVLDSIISSASVTVEPALDPCSEENMKFTIKKGTKWPGDYFILDKCTNQTIKNPTVRLDLCNPEEVDSSQFFEDWVLDTKHFALIETAEFERYVPDGLPVICIDPKEKLTLTMTVNSSLDLIPVTPVGQTADQLLALQSFLADLESAVYSLYIPSGSGAGYTSVTLAGINNYINVTGTDRDLEFFGNKTVVPRYSSWPLSFSTTIGMSFPPSMIIPANSSIVSSENQTPGNSGTDANIEAAQSRLYFDYTILPDGFIFQGSFIFEEIIPNNNKISPPLGSVLSSPEPVPLSASWTSFEINDADIAAGHVLLSDLRFKCSQLLTGDVNLSCGSLLRKGSVLAEVFTTGKGMVSSKSTNITAGTVVQADFEVCKQSTSCAGASFIAGTVFRKSSSLPSGFFITNGNTAPADIIIPTSANITLAPGLELNKPVLGGGFTWNVGTGFEPCSELPANAILSAGVVLPSGSKIPAGSKFPFPFPNPAGYIYETCKPIPAGTVFASSTVLPEIFARPNLVPGPIGGIGNTPQATVPYYFIFTDEDVSYFVVKSGTVLSKGCSLPQGTVLLATQNMDALANYVSGTPLFSVGASGNVAMITGTPDTWNTTQVAGDGSLVLQEADYNYAYCQGPAGSDFTLKVGIPTENGVNLLVQVITPYDLAIPITDSQTIFKGFIFNVPFTVRVSSPILCDYLVSHDNKVSHPQDKELPSNVQLNTDFTIPVQATLVRRITLPAYPGCFITSLIPTASAFIKYPTNSTTTNKRFKIGTAGLKISNVISPEVVSKATITLKLGNKIDVINSTGGTQLSNALYLSSLVSLPCDWKILEDITSTTGNLVPALTLTGFFLPAGAYLPVSITVDAGEELPAGLQTSGPIQLAEDYEVPPCSSPLLIKSGSRIVERSVFERGTEIVGGMNASGLIYGKVECWSADGELSLSAGDSLPETFQYNFFSGTDLEVYQRNTDVDLLTLKVNDLEVKVLTLLALLGAQNQA